MALLVEGLVRDQLFFCTHQRGSAHICVGQGRKKANQFLNTDNFSELELFKADLVKNAAVPCMSREGGQGQGHRSCVSRGETGKMREIHA